MDSTPSAAASGSASQSSSAPPARGHMCRPRGWTGRSTRPRPARRRPRRRWSCRGSPAAPVYACRTRGRQNRRRYRPPRPAPAATPRTPRRARCTSAPARPRPRRRRAPKTATSPGWRGRVGVAANHGGHAAEQPDGGDGGRRIAQDPARVGPAGPAPPSHAELSASIAANSRTGTPAQISGDGGCGKVSRSHSHGAGRGQREQGDEPPGIGAHHGGGQDGQQNNGGNDTLAQHVTVSSCAARKDARSAAYFGSSPLTWALVRPKRRSRVRYQSNAACNSAAPKSGQ